MYGVRFLIYTFLMMNLSLQKPNDQANSYVFFDSPPKDIAQTCYVPMMGRRAACGLFGISDDFIEEYQSLDSKFIKNKEATFFFKASGDSMEPLIFSGDTLVVDRSITSFHNRVCIVIYQDQLVCKRVRVNSLQTSAQLISENSKCSSITINNNLDAIVWGVVIARVSHL